MNNNENNKNYENFATELLHEIKIQTKRWFIAFCVMVAVEVVTVGGFLWYISLPSDNVTVENQDGNANYIGNDLYGDVNNGKDNSDTESGEITENSE